MEVKKEIIGQTLILTISGVIDETSDFQNKTGESFCSVIVECKDIQRINSLGVKFWINYFSSLTSKGIKVSLNNCPPCIVDQLSMIDNFHCGCEIVSVLVPYECEECQSELVISAKIQWLKSNGIQLPTLKCNKCQGTASFSDIEEEYFAFLSHTK